MEIRAIGVFPVFRFLTHFICWLMSFAFPFGRLLGVRWFCYYPYSFILVCTLRLSCYCFYIVLSLYLYGCYVVNAYHHLTVISLQTCVLCFVLLLFLPCFFILVLLLCCAYISSLYCNISSDLCTLCFSCCYFDIVLSLYLYFYHVVYTDHQFTDFNFRLVYSEFFLLLLLHCFIFTLVLSLCCVIYLQTCVLCVCLVVSSILFYLYMCTVVVLCILIITLL
jgi:hypothetical protein